MKPANYFLDDDYGVDFLNGSKKLSELFTAAQVQTDRKELWGWAKFKGWSDDEIMSLRNMEAAWHDAFWRGQNGSRDNGYAAATPMPAANITVPAGKFLVSTCLPVGPGIYTGQGSRFSDDGQQGHTFGSTELVMDHAGWKLSRFPEKFLMRTSNWGASDDLGAWMHHTVIRHFNFNGARRQTNLVQGQPTTALVAGWEFSEASDIYACFFHHSEGDGLLLKGATPTHISKCSAFNNNGHGAACVGSGNFEFDGFSGDENGLSLIGGKPGYGLPGNGTITIIAFKYETGTSPKAFRPFKGQAAFSFEGWWTVNIHGGTFASTAIYPYAFIHTKGPVNTPSITWDGVQFFGNAPKCILYDEATDTEYTFGGNAYATYHDNGRWTPAYGLKCDWPITIATAKRTPKGLLQHVGPDGATSWATAGIYSPYGAATPIPPPTCTWVLGTPVIGPCQPNGTQEVRTPYVPSIAGCTPSGTKPADQVTSQPCTPPTTGTVIAKLPADPQTGWSNTQAGYKLTVDWKGTRKLDFAGLNPRSLASKSIVRNAAGDRVVIGPDGKLYVNIAGVERTAKNAAGADIVLTVNVAQNVTIDLWAPVDFTRVGDSNFTSSTNNNAFVGSWTKLTVSK